MKLSHTFATVLCLILFFFTKAKTQIPAINPPIFSNEEEKLLYEEVYKLLDLFTKSLEVISDKDAPRNLRNYNIEVAASLFVENISTIEVSNVYLETINSYPYSVYLKRLKTLYYSKVKLKIKRISLEFLKTKYGEEYQLIGQYEHAFRAYSILDKNVLVYKDNTVKEVLIVCRKKYDQNTGEEYWDIKFLKIEVIKTT